MKTDELINLLAQGEVAVDPHVLRRRYAFALGGGALATTLLMTVFLGVQSGLGQAVRLPMFWVKLVFPALVLAGALLATVRMSRPGTRIGNASVAIAAPVLALWLLAAVLLMLAEPGELQALILGSSWVSCSVNIAALSAPLFLAMLWAMKGLAPTQPALAGAAAGLLAGAGAALAYALYCTEMSAPFVGIWYVLGMAIPAVTGAWVGPKVLRW